MLLVTGFAESAARERAQLSVKVEVITKPYRRQELADRVHKILTVERRMPAEGDS